MCKMSDHARPIKCYETLESGKPTCICNFQPMLYAARPCSCNPSPLCSVSGLVNHNTQSCSHHVRAGRITDLADMQTNHNTIVGGTITIKICHCNPQANLACTGPGCAVYFAVASCCAPIIPCGLWQMTCIEVKEWPQAQCCEQCCIYSCAGAVTMSERNPPYRVQQP